MSRALSKEELREQVMQHIRSVVDKAATQAGLTEQERCDVVAIAILGLLDGAYVNLPGFDIVARPHPDDMPYDIANGNDYIQDGTVINDDCQLRELYYRH